MQKDQLHTLTPDFILEKTAQGHLDGGLLGAALFIDLSGFTTATEMLMRHGKEGAEVLADALLAIFTPIIGHVHENGGFVAYFAGDAIVAIFPAGDDASTRALSAAQAARRHMAAHPTQQTEFGTLNFAVKCCLAWGEVRWRIWRTESLERTRASAQQAVYLVDGDAIDLCMAAERAASGGEILADESMVRRAPAIARYFDRMESNGAQAERTHYRYREPDVLLGDLTMPDPVSQPRSADTLPSITGRPIRALFQPQELIDRPLRGEFRDVVSVFLNVDRRPGQPPDDSFVSTLLQLLARYGGYLCRFARNDPRLLDGSFLLFWGAPSGHENDLERALGFLLDLKTEVDAVFRAGVTQRVVYAGFVGSPTREEYTCYGLGVIMAARLIPDAPWGEIWLDKETAHRARARYVLEYVRDMTFKGIGQPQSIFALQRRHSTRARTEYDGRLIGRQQELAQLHGAAAPVLAEKGAGAVVLTGDAGMGKGRLIAEYRRRFKADAARPINWFSCPADEILRQSLNPYRHFLRTYFSQSRSLPQSMNRLRFEQGLDELLAKTESAELCHDLTRGKSFLGAVLDLTWPDSLYASFEPRLRFENTLLALTALIKAESLLRPTVLILEELQWFDHDSLLFLKHLGRNIDGFPCLIIGSSRTPVPPDIFSPAFEPMQLPIHPLSSQEMEQFVATFTQTGVSPSLLSLLMQRSGGNPFYLEQMMRHVQEAGDSELWTSDDGLDEIRALIPANVRSLLIARIDRLLDDVKQTVQTAAALGMEFELSILSEMLLGEVDAAATVAGAEQEAIWSALHEKRYIFAHALLRDTAYDMQLQARLRHLHALAARAIEQVYTPDLSPHLEALAFHCDRADQPVDAVRWYHLAGKRAADRYANQQAVEYFSRALALTPDTYAAERFDLLVARQGVFDILGDRKAQADDLVALETIAYALDDEARQLEALQRRADYAWKTGAWYEARILAESGETMARRLSDVLAEAECLSIQARAARATARYDDAEELVQKARNKYAQVDAQVDVASMVSFQGNLAWDRGDYSRAISCHEDAISFFHEMGELLCEVNALNSLGTVYWSTGDYGRAESVHERSLQLSRELGYRVAEADNMDNMGGTAWALGEYDAAIERYSAALEIRRQADDKRGMAISLSNLGLAYSSIAAYEPSLEHYRRALELDQSLGRRRGEAYDHHGLGMVQLALHNYAEASREITTALAIRDELGETQLAVESRAALAAVYLAMGDVAGATALVESVLSFLENGSPDGAAEPFRIYWTCYQTLTANQDARAAAILETAHTRLLELAAKIEDERRRHSYLTNIDIHRQIVATHALLGR